MLSALLDHIRRFTPLGADEEARLADFVETRALGKREHLFRAGAPASQLAFVGSGFCRLYSVDAAATERTLQFGLEGWWLTDWDAFVRGGPSEFSLQAVEECEVALVRGDRYEAMLEAIPSLERYFRRVHQRGHAAGLRRIHLMRARDAAELYWNFQHAYPEFVERVPQYMLASFLGFTPEFLSKIRARGRPRPGTPE